MRRRRSRPVPAHASATAEAEGWPDWLQEELANSLRNGCVGRQIVMENVRARIWRARLEPNERMAFHCHTLDYCWIALSDGVLQSRHASGRIDRYDLVDGTVYFRRVPKDGPRVRDLENVGNAALEFMVVEFLDSANPPLPVPDHVRLR